MIFTTKKGKDLWQSLWWARDQAGAQAIDVIRGCLLALVESGKYDDHPYPIQVSMASAHVHDAYYQGRKWQYDLDAKLLIIPGKRYYVKPVQSKLNQFVFDFMAESHSPFKDVPGKGTSWANAFEIPVVTRDFAGAMFAIAEEQIMKSPSIVYPPHWRMIKAHIYEQEKAA